MPNGHAVYAHLPLPRVVTGRPKKLGRDNDQETQEMLNKANRAGHAQDLADAGARIIGNMRRWRDERPDPEAHPLPAGVPLIIRTEPGIDLDFLRSAFAFEVIAENEEGFVLVASEDIDLEKFLAKAKDFEQAAHGSGATAKVYSLVEDGDDRGHRLERLLSPELLEKWPTLADDSELVVDLGIGCTGTKAVPNKPRQEADEADARFATRMARYGQRTHEWWDEFDALMREREKQVSQLVESYSGVILDQSNELSFPDCFTVRARLPFRGVRDVVFNYPYLFEITEPDLASDPDSFQLNDLGADLPAPEPPSNNAPTVAIVDSGLQEAHPLIRDAVRPNTSVSFVPGDAGVADMVAPDGHGTRVAGALLYPNGHPAGFYELPCWVCNVRVLDQTNSLSDLLIPQNYIGKVVAHLSNFENPARIINHSVTSTIGYRHRYMSSWGAAIDQVSYNGDVLFIQAAGNLRSNNPTFPYRAVNHHLANGRPYPEYLLREECRVANPSQSFQALTVGSISSTEWDALDRKSMARNLHPSAFTTSGLGIWGTIKPDVVEVGGDLAVDKNVPPTAGPHTDCSVELVRANLGPGGEVSKDAIGTSFAAPRVAFLASRIQQLLPEEPTLLYRALIANSARWPEWSEQHGQPEDVLRLIGYGLPSLPRCTESNDHRVTLITQGLQEIGGFEAHLYRIPIPKELRTPALNSRVRIDVALSYSALPRRTRRNPRGYLSTWMSWKSSCKNESYDSFASRIVEELNGNAPRDGEAQIDWMLREDGRSGQIRSVNRSVGTLQKDWAVMAAHELPSDFCVAVFGHKGWDKNSENRAHYALTVSIESLDTDLELYAPIQVEIEKLIVEVSGVHVRVGT